VPDLFSPLTIRAQSFANRAWVSPMCMYSAEGGVVTDWHLVHLGALAAGGAGLVMTEATGVTPEGRISPACPGIWSDEQAQAWSRVVSFVRGQDAVAGIQLAHAGRKASTAAPWDGGGYVAPADGGWQTVGPSDIAFGTLPAPRPMSADDIGETVTAFATAARRSLDVGFDVIELHAAHGYLLHQFLSPLSNMREDDYGGSLDNRMRLPIEVAVAVREVWPADRPLFMRISTTDWMSGGWDVSQSIELARRLHDVGVDLIDASSGGLHHEQRIPDRVEYQTDIAAELRREAGLLVGAVGRITDPHQADALIRDGKADAVFLARQMLRDPHWPQRAAHELGADVRWPRQYLRAASWRS
jgi:2,4-dienoyl-CoA reductase-like NADH-dependent reductase (Old Yellow Enzyme family)